MAIDLNKQLYDQYNNPIRLDKDILMTVRDLLFIALNQPNDEKRLERYYLMKKIASGNPQLSDIDKSLILSFGHNVFKTPWHLGLLIEALEQ